MSNFDPIPVSIKQQLMTELCEQIDDAIFILDGNLRYLTVNASYELLIGYKESFLVGRPLVRRRAAYFKRHQKQSKRDRIS